MSPPDRYASSVRDVIRVSLPSIASDRFPTSTGESLVLHCDYIVSHGGKVQILRIDRGSYKDTRFPFGLEKFYRAGLES